MQTEQIPPKEIGNSAKKGKHLKKNQNPLTNSLRIFELLYEYGQKHKQNAI